MADNEIDWSMLREASEFLHREVREAMAKKRPINRPGLRQLCRGYVVVQYTVTCRCKNCQGSDDPERVSYEDFELTAENLYDHLVSGELGIRTEKNGFQPWRLVKGRLIHPDCYEGGD